MPVSEDASETPSVGLLPCAGGEPPLRARLRTVPEDFIVEEQLGFDADQAGDHLWLQVRKRGANTDWVARQFARHFGVPPVDVGYAGLKDRDGLTTQVFTVHWPGRETPAADSLSIEGVEVLALARHRRKLKRGGLQGNRFRLHLREVTGDRDAAEACLRALATRGAPNYFGEQRFGLGGGNVDRARAMFAGRRVDRQARSLLLSSARSYLFNLVLAHRVQDGTWSSFLDGEVGSLDGSRSWFEPEPWNDTLAGRLDAGDIHPSGPLWGRGALPSRGAAQALESAVLEPHADLRAGLEQAGLEQDRRALRLRPRRLDWQWADAETLVLDFDLPAGAYATVLVRELARV